MQLLRLKKAEEVKVKLQKQQLKEVRQVFHRAAQDIERQYNNLPPAIDNFGYAQQLYLEDLQTKITRETYQVYNEIGGLVEKGALAASEAVATEMTAWCQKIGFAGSFAAVPRKTIDLLISGQVYDKPWTLSSAVWNNAQYTEKIVREIVAQGLAEQKSTLEIIRDVETYIDPVSRKPWNWGRVHPQAETIVDYNAQRLVRSMIQHSYEQTIVMTTKDNPFCVGIKWTLANSHNHCPWCIANSIDNSYGLGAGIFPQDELPLDHPNGYCIFIPVMVDSDLIADRIGRWAKGGSDPALDKYQQYLLENDA